MSDRLKTVCEFRERMNERLLGAANLDIKRFFALDSRASGPGALPARTKDLLGPVRCAMATLDELDREEEAALSS